MPRFDAGQVRRYYDRHTTEFIALGQGGGVGAIHRAVWGPGTRGRPEAFRYVEDRIADHIRCLIDADGSPVPHVLDLGCGVGATLCGLAEHLTIQGTGITLSPVQVQLAERRIRDAGLSHHVRCIVGDYCDLPADLADVDLAYAIESFVHGPDPARFFDECARIVRLGGYLVICDDFRRAMAGSAGTRMIERFCRGWHVNTLLQPAELVELANRAGFRHESTMNLTPYLEIGRPRDRATAALVALVGWIPIVATRFDYLIGGSALQTCLAQGLIEYDLALFRRVG